MIEAAKKPSRYGKKFYIRSAIVILSLAAICYIIWFFTAVPNPKIDYSETFNNMARPVPTSFGIYADSNNAFLEFQPAFDYLVPQPRVLSESYYIEWPGDYSEPNRTLCKEWLDLNASAFVHVVSAVTKRYYWVERESDDRLEDIDMLRKLSTTLSWAAKWKAYNGDYSAAFDLVLTQYKAGMMKCKPYQTYDQSIGYRLKSDAMQSALIIFDRSDPPSAELTKFQNQLENLIESDNFVCDFAGIKLSLYEIVDKTFHQNMWGTGHLAWTQYRNFMCMCGDPWYVWIYCFGGVNAKEMKQSIDQYIKKFDDIKQISPYELKRTKPNYYADLEQEKENNFLLRLYGSDYKTYILESWATKIRSRAVLALAAILKYKQDTGQLPNNLEKLTESGYLKELPLDPFGSGSLTYKPDKDNFILYSFGDDCIDNKGNLVVDYSITRRYDQMRDGTDEVYWPVQRAKRPQPLPSNPMQLGMGMPGMGLPGSLGMTMANEPNRPKPAPKPKKRKQSIED